MKKKWLGLLCAGLMTVGATASVGCSGDDCFTCAVMSGSHCVGDALGDLFACSVEGIGATNACYSDCSLITCWYCGKENYIDFCVDMPILCGASSRNTGCGDVLNDCDVCMFIDDYQTVIDETEFSYDYKVLGTSSISSSTTYYRSTIQVYVTAKERAWTNVRATFRVAGGENSTTAVKYLGYCDKGKTVITTFTVVFAGAGVDPSVTGVGYRGNRVKE